MSKHIDLVNTLDDPSAAAPPSPTPVPGPPGSQDGNPPPVAAPMIASFAAAEIEDESGLSEEICEHLSAHSEMV